MRVGVVIPARGPAPHLAEAVASVLAEGPAAVVVVDDGSDPPLPIAAGVDVVRRAAPGGPATARNAGVAALPSDLDAVAFCDADDAWQRGSLAARVAALAADGGPTAVFGRPRIVGPDGEPTGEAWPLPGRVLREVGDLYARNPLLLSSVVARRGALPAFDERFSPAEDWELWLRLLAAGGTVGPVPEAEVSYRRHPGALTADVLALARAQQRVHEAYAAHVPAALRERAAAADRAALAAGLVRARRWREARELMAPGPRRALAAVPGLRGVLGRRDPYRR